MLLAGCEPKPQDAAATANALPNQQALKNLKAQAGEAGRSAVEEDHAKLAQLTHPALLDMFGGRAAYIKKLESVAADMKGRGYQLKRFSLGEPSQLVKSAGQVYALVPSEVQLSGPDGATGRQRSYLIAVSADGGAHWTFIDGAGIAGDRRKAKSLLPDFPDQLQLPAAQPP